MPNAPLASVLLPVHDGGEWLVSAVASVLAQSWRNLELLVGDITAPQRRSPSGAG
ncbi:MAG: hypothetical protein IT479_13400 [Xanthomonadales bacterium]|nr:hypothetical protein [Xanthomonadales bacterium]